MRKKYAEGRKPTVRSLPRLAEACADFTGFARGENRTERVYTLLAEIIQRHRRATPQAFYAMREVAKFFGIALNTVHRVYRRLDREGVLTLVRSSQSLMAARAPRPRFAVRGVVCMPIWLPGFLYFLDWRKWFSQLEEEIARYHFVLEPIFYKVLEELRPDFVDRVLRFNPDYVLWSWPSKDDLTTMLSIADAGVPLVLVQDAGEQFPGRVYQTSYERGLRRGLGEWSAGRKIREVVIPVGGMGGKLDSLKSMLKASGLPYRLAICPGNKASMADYTSYLRRLASDRRTGVLFADELLYVQLCSMIPEAMLDLIREHRVIVMRQSTVHLRRNSLPPGLTVDALIFPWKKLARQIARDLGKSKGALPAGHIALEAEWRPRTPLGIMVQGDFHE